jgi:hypothetical protein
VTQFESKNSACFQKAVIKLGRRRMRFKRAHRMIAERHKRLRTEVGKLMLLSVPPQVFHWIELGCISRQILKLNLAVLAKHKVFDQSAAMAFDPRLPTCPWGCDASDARETERPAGYGYCPGKAEVKIPPGHPSHGRKGFPVKGVLQHWGLSPRRPCPATVGPLAKPALISEHYGALLALGFF